MSLHDLPPRFQAIRLRCAQCSHQWTSHLAVDCPIDLMLASMRAMIKGGCPSCGATKRRTVLMITKEAPSS